MEVNSNLLARLISELPGLTGALQPAQTVAQNIVDMARRERAQNLANAMLAAASGLLAPSPNGYRLSPLQRLGMGLGAALESYDETAPRAQILDALRIQGRQGQSGASAGAPELSGETAQRAAEESPAKGYADNRAVAGVRFTQRTVGAPHQSRPARLREFTGSVGVRLNHPAVLPGGWTLYGYEKATGRPVYLGPEQRLGIYA
jgi:hypothetical protein